MALSDDDIISKFPVKMLPTIQGAPNYKTISAMMQALYGNAVSLSTTSGGDTHGHIRLIMTPALYQTLTTAPYVVPLDPGILPQIPNRLSTQKREQIIQQHKEDRRIFHNNTNMDGTLNGQNIDTILCLHQKHWQNPYPSNRPFSSKIKQGKQVNFAHA